MKQTPEIVIPASEISCCTECPFFVASAETIFWSDFYCEHPRMGKIFGNSRKKMFGSKERWADPDQDVWIHCPLPDVEQGDKE